MSKRRDREGGRCYNPKINIIVLACNRLNINLKTYCMLKRLINKPINKKEIK